MLVLCSRKLDKTTQNIENAKQQEGTGLSVEMVIFKEYSWASVLIWPQPAVRYLAYYI